MSSEDATTAFFSAHVNYDLKNGFHPIAEFNWFHVARSGNGAPRFPDEVGGLVPVIGVFEDGDLISLGSQYATTNREIMTGFPSRETIPRTPKLPRFGVRLQARWNFIELLGRYSIILSYESPTFFEIQRGGTRVVDNPQLRPRFFIFEKAGRPNRLWLVWEMRPASSNTSLPSGRRFTLRRR